MASDLVESDKPTIPYANISGNHTIFVVLKETLIYINDDPQTTHKLLQTTLTFKNMGQVKF
jgi:hypothetical protein